MYFARACVRAHACMCRQTGRSMHTLGKHEGRTAAHRKKTAEKPFPTRKNNRDTVKFIRNQGHFFQGTERKAWKNPFLPPKKSRIFRICSPGTVSFMSSKEQKFSRNRRFLPTGERKFPKNGQFYASRRTKIFRESPFFANRRTKISQKRPFLCQPKEKNFARKAIFVPAEGQKFREKDHFFCQPEDKNFPKTASSAPAGRRKKWIQRPFSFARLGNPDQNFSPERQEIRKKFPEKLETELHVHKQNRDFSMQQGKWRHGNLASQGHFCTGRPAFFMFPCRETYVLPGGNLRFPTGKPTVYTPET